MIAIRTNNRTHIYINVQVVPNAFTTDREIPLYAYKSIAQKYNLPQITTVGFVAKSSQITLLVYNI